MKRIVIGTAGHVDHGKTSLIKALTGVDCDRLKEEKLRGLTIELGFTSLDLPSGEKVGIVDVPGHVRFIRHMLSGASGIDLVMLIVAADEGVMPQTIEHIQICQILGIKYGIIVMTKVDLVDEDMLELAVSDVTDFVEGTFLKDAPLVKVSSTRRTGIDELKDMLDEQINEVQERQLTGIPVLPIDRVFSIKGFGTVVTGTLSRGSFSEDQEVEILPSTKTARIRNLQVHGREVEQAVAGTRTAVNLQGVGVEDISRGEWIVPAGLFVSTRLIDAKIDLINKPGKGGIKLYMGTSETVGEMNIHTIDDHVIGRIRLKDPVVASRGERFIIRSVSPSQTLGGGTVLNPHPKRRLNEEVIRDLIDEDLHSQIVGFVKDAGVRGISRREIASALAEQGQRLDRAFQEVLSSGRIVRFDSRNDLFVYVDYMDKLKGLVTKVVSDFHRSNPTSQGISKEHVRSSLKGNVDPKLFHKVVQDLIKSRQLDESGPNVMECGFSASLSKDLGKIGEEARRIFISSGLEPPRPAEIAGQLGVTIKELGEIMGFMSRDGRLVRIKDDLFLAKENEEVLRDKVKAFLMKSNNMTPADMKEVAGVSRKYAIPYMEYLDRIRFTIRVDNVRKLGVSKQQT